MSEEATARNMPVYVAGCPYCEYPVPHQHAEPANPLDPRSVLPVLKPDERTIEGVLRAYAVDSTENQGLHGWRCRYPEQYGKCSCFEDLVKDLEALSPKLPDRLDVDMFLAGLDSPNHNDESRRAWIALFYQDMKRVR